MTLTITPAPRHTLMRRRLTHVVAAASAVLLLVGCASAVGESRAGGEPAEGGTLRVGTTTDLIPATVFTNSNGVSNVLIGNVYDTLIDYPLESLEAKPALATSWKVAEDGTGITLQLRDDVTFHSGRELTSKDVEFAIRTWADPVWTVQFQRTAAAVTGFDTSDPHAITLTFAHPVSNILDLLDVLPIIDSESLDDVREGKGFVGTGPFVFDSWAPGSKLKLVRNEKYWGEKPHLDAVEVSVTPDAQALASQLRAGQLDAAIGVSGRDIESLSKDEGFVVTQRAGAESQVYLGTNVENKALADIRVRQALAHALDRDRIIKEVYRGYGKAAVLPWPSYSPAYDASAQETFGFDLAAAKDLVTEAKADGTKIPTLPLTYPAGGDLDAIAQIVQEDLAGIGITVELEPLEQAQVVKKLIGGQFEGLWLLNHSYAQFTPSTLAVSAYPFNADNNSSHYVDAGYKAAADAAWKQSAEKAAQPETYEALNKELLSGLFLLEIGILESQQVTTSKVGGVGLDKRNEPLYGAAYLTE